MTEPVTVTDEQREELAAALCVTYDCMGCEATGRAATAWLRGVPTFTTCPLGLRAADTLVPLIARMIADARAEVSAAVEAVIQHHASEFYTPSLRVEAVHVDALRAALADPASAVVRRLTNGCRRCGRPLGDAFDSDDHACPTPTDRIGGESDA